MISCDEAGRRISLYVDRELSGREALELEAHLTECARCRMAYDDLRAVVDAVRTAGPLYEAPANSYAAVEELVAKHNERRWIWRTAAAAGVLIALTGMWMARRPSAPAQQYASFAAEAHLLYARGAFPLDVVSHEPQVVSDWMAQRLPFHMTLPNYPTDGREQKRYSLVGARLMHYLDEDVAYLAYEMDRRPISLLIASSARVVPSGGQIYESGGLKFHSSAQKGLRMITWTDKGLTYALVSTLDAPGAESCVICHGAANDRTKFESLRETRPGGDQRF